MNCFSSADVELDLVYGKLQQHFSFFVMPKQRDSILCGYLFCHRPVCSVVRTLLLVREVLGSNPGSVKSNTESPTARHRCDVFRNYVVQTLSRGDDPATRYTFRRNTASMMTICLFCLKCDWFCFFGSSRSLYLCFYFCSYFPWYLEDASY